MKKQVRACYILVKFCLDQILRFTTPEMYGFDWRNISLIVCVIRVFSIPLPDNWVH